MTLTEMQTKYQQMIAEAQRLQMRMAELKAQIKKARECASTTGPLNLSTPDGLINAAHVVLHRLACDGVDLDPDEKVVVAELNAYLTRRPAP